MSYSTSGLAAVGDDHLAARLRGDGGGPQLGDHAAGAQAGAAVRRQGETARRPPAPPWGSGGASGWRAGIACRTARRCPTSSTSRSAPHWRRPRWPTGVSFSPMVFSTPISSVATVSFSLMIGSAPSSSRRDSVLRTLRLRCSSFDVLAGQQQSGLRCGCTPSNSLS